MTDQYPSCEVVPVGKCNKCVNANITNVGPNSCSYNKKTGECTAFPNANTTKNCSNVNPFPRPPGPQPHPHPGQVDDGKCNTNDDCVQKKNGECRYDGNYKNPSKKCYYPCTTNRQCSDLGQQCLQNGYCGISDQPTSPWSRIIDGNDDKKDDDSIRKKMQESIDLQEKMLEDISNLQNLEQYLIRLLSNPNLTEEEKDEIVTKIENLTQMRINLYKNLKSINSFSTPVSNNTVGDQQTAVDIMEDELNKLKRTLSESKQTRLNKIRMIEINNYYSSRYEEHASVLKTGIVFVLAFVVLFALKAKGFLPETVFTVLKYILVIATVYFLGSKVLSMWMRDSMNYDEYDWNFNPNTAPVSSTSTSKLSWNGILSGLGFQTCV